jgi:aminoglycoside phosphotransferase (APT) family kinase protein
MTRTALFDTEPLREYLESRLDLEQPVAFSAVETGRSNETIIVTHGSQKLVLRKPPEGATSESAHDVLREYRIMDALQDTAVPVPETVLSCSDPSVIGSEFYVMEYLDGYVIRDTMPGEPLSKDERKRFSEVYIDTLASIHTVDIEAVGLDSLGSPEGFTERQVDRWRKQLEWALQRTERRSDLAELEAVGEWLEANAPESPPQTLVHGDYKIDNMIFTRTPEVGISGVLDWEMGTYGDPLTDLGWLLIHWQDRDDPDPIFPEVRPEFLEADGYASRRELVARYERKSGIEFTDERFYRALATYKEAAACEVFHARYLEGDENPFFEQMEQKVPQVAVQAKQIVDGECDL